MTPQASAQLAFWSKNMISIWAGHMDWPGFSYTQAEWARMETLAAPISNGTYQKFVFANAAVFIAIAAAGIALVFLPLATLLFPVPAETSALKFSLLLAGCCFMIIGLGLPVSLRAATYLCASGPMLAAIAPVDGDVALAAKIAWQINRIMLVMCGLLVPGMLLFITYDIDAGPIITVLKWLAIALMGVSIVFGRRQRGRS